MIGLTVFTLFVFFVIALIRPKKPVIVSHWHNLIQGLQFSVEDYYNALDAVIEKRKVPEVKVEVTHYREGGIASAKRMYLRIGRRDHIFDVCAAPFGTDFFVSWWLGQNMKTMGAIINGLPFIGPPLIRLFSPETFYRIDTALMFQDSVHQAVLEVLDDRIKGQGLRSMTESERKPIMRELFKQRR
ncbi:MAG TPA: hypothetical protein VMF88_10650 [Bacteroidota bacterium]|nr:hypothetical protein [Bacteroidota bacterium]